jgi:hypothetical protein
MSLSRFKRIVLACPVVKTGGPEAIHQLAYTLRSLKLDCSIAYFGQGHSLSLRDGALVCEPASAPESAAYYDRYFPHRASRVPLNDETIVIFPEGVATTAAQWRGPTAIWWLSVDNAERGDRRMTDPAFRAELFRRPEIVHLHQSAYARDFLRAQGAQRLYDLGDYTSELFTLGPKPTVSGTPNCAYNQIKGSELAEAFFATNTAFDGLPLRGYSTAQLKEIFQERMFYIDFGHFPGKDRLPREAAACGSIVFVNRRGAGAMYEDFPLHDMFKFTEADVSSGELARRLEAVAAAPELHFELQASFRDVVFNEKSTFQAQVARHWGQPQLT